MPEDDELLDLVDENDNIVGTIRRSEKSNKLKVGSEFLRASELLIVNKNGELWIPRRSLNKHIAPGGLDYSTGGHVASGESYMQALIREVKEELNLEISPESLKLLYKFSPIGSELAYIKNVYILESDETPDYNK